MPSTEIYRLKEKLVTVKGYQGYVAEIDRTKGINIRDLDDQSLLLCLNLKHLKELAKSNHIAGYMRTYHSVFTFIMQGIERGIVPTFVINLRNGIDRVSPSQGSMPDCAWS